MMLRTKVTKASLLCNFNVKSMQDGFKCMWKNIVFVDVVFDHYPGCGLMRSI